jgi:hypothetical protein
MTAAQWMDTTGCDSCGKRSYHTRRDARRARRAHHSDAKGLQAYPCPVGLGFHLGHLDPQRAPRANLNDPRIRLVPAPEHTTTAAQTMARMAGRLAP